MSFPLITGDVAKVAAAGEDFGWQWLRATLLVLIMVLTYLNIPLVSGSRLLVPSYPVVALTPLLFLVVYRSLSTPDIMFVLKATFLLLLSIALSPGYVHMNEKFLSLAQCVIALTVATMTVLLMRQLRPAVLERALLILWILIIAGCILEITGVTRAASDSFRAWAYEGTYTLYSGYDRDVRLVGWERPKLFSTEPSHVSTLFIAAINSWLLVRVTKAKVGVALTATVTMLAIMGSPMIIVSGGITLAILIWNREIAPSSRFAMVLAALLVGALFVYLFAENTASNVSSRIERIGDETVEANPEISSENLRVVYPYMTLYEVLRRWPLFGAGIGGKEVLMEHITIQGLNPNYIMGTNGFAQIGIYLGLLGGAIFLWLICRQAMRAGVERVSLLLVIIAAIAQLQGGIDSIRFWGFIAPLWGALAVADSKTRKHKPTASTALR